MVEIRGSLPILTDRVGRVLELHSRNTYRARRWVVMCKECGLPYPCETRKILLGSLEQNIKDTGVRWFLTRETEEIVSIRKIWQDCPTCKNNPAPGWVPGRGGILKQCPTCHGKLKIEVEVTRQKRPKRK